VVSHQPSDISRLKKSVPKLPTRFRTFVAANIVRKDSGEIRNFAAVAATLLTLGNRKARFPLRSLNRSVASRYRKGPEKGG